MPERRPRLVASDPADPGTREFPLPEAEFAIGSGHGNDLELRATGVSRQHALISFRGGRYIVRDLDSTNGTFVNNRRITGSSALANGDRVRFAGVAFTFVDTVPAASVAPARRSVARRTLILLLLFAASFVLTMSLRHGELINLAGRPGPQASLEPTANEIAAATEPSPAATSDESSTPEADWLARLNYYRELAKLPPVSEDPVLSQGDFNHARYMVKNSVPLNSSAHDEDPATPWYTPEGRAAARDGDLIPGCEGCPKLTDAQAIDLWMVGPFHRILLLNPELRRVGFGEFHGNKRHAYAINLGLAPSQRFEPPIAFPPDGTTIALQSLRGEWPDPLASCPDYSAPAGLPITLELGPHISPEVSAYSLSADGKVQEVCEFDQTNYSNPDARQQAWGRNGLGYFGAIVLIPREELVPEERYVVSVTTNGHTYEWMFDAAGSP